MNSVVLIGKLARDPELRFTAAGKAVTTFSIYVRRMYSKEKEVDFFNIVVWGKPAENCANYIKKGSLVGIQGRLQSRSYEQNGEKRYVTEVVADQVEFLDRKADNNTTPASEKNFASTEMDLSEFESVDDSDLIPF